MKKHLKKITISLIFIILIFTIYKQNVEIQNLQTDIANLTSKNYTLKNLTSNESETNLTTIDDSTESFNYLAIGNSITWHRICSYWWSEHGMAATSSDKDYYHLIVKSLEAKLENVNSTVYSFISWETLATDRAETLTLIDEYLNENLDLVTVQLGENVTDNENIENDFLELINYIKEKAPNAQIIIVGNFWEDEVVENAKMYAAEKTNSTYVSLQEIQNNQEYKNNVGDIVFDADGNEHQIDNSAVAAHPNDKAMSYIAEKILNTINAIN